MGMKKIQYFDQNREPLVDGAFYQFSDPRSQLWQLKLVPGKSPMFRQPRCTDYFELDQVKHDEAKGGSISLGKILLDGFFKVSEDDVKNKIRFMRSEADWYETHLAESF